MEGGRKRPFSTIYLSGRQGRKIILFSFYSPLKSHQHASLIHELDLKSKMFPHQVLSPPHLELSCLNLTQGLCLHAWYCSIANSIIFWSPLLPQIFNFSKLWPNDIWGWGCKSTIPKYCKPPSTHFLQSQNFKEAEAYASTQGYFVPQKKSLKSRHACFRIKPLESDRSAGAPLSANNILVLVAFEVDHGSLTCCCRLEK